MSGELNPARLELQAAAKAIAEMRNAKSLPEFEVAWRALLNCLEKAWIKTERCCSHVRAQFEPWQGQYHRLRRKDMLLRYLKQARDADNHSIQDVAKLEPGSRSIRFANPGGGHIKRLVMRDGRITHYEGDAIVVEDKMPTVVAIPVKNSGAWYNPPTSHLDKPVSSQHPLYLSELGLKFYEQYINDVAEKFFPKKP